MKPVMSFLCAASSPFSAQVNVQRYIQSSNGMTRVISSSQTVKGRSNMLLSWSKQHTASWSRQQHGAVVDSSVERMMSRMLRTSRTAQEENARGVAWPHLPWLLQQNSTQTTALHSRSLGHSPPKSLALAMQVREQSIHLCFASPHPAYQHCLARYCVLHLLPHTRATAALSIYTPATAPPATPPPAAVGRIATSTGYCCTHNCLLLLHRTTASHHCLSAFPKLPPPAPRRRLSRDLSKDTIQSTHAPTAPRTPAAAAPGAARRCRAAAGAPLSFLGDWAAVSGVPTAEGGG